MSWIFGQFRQSNNTPQDKLKSVHQQAQFKFENRNYYIAAGGNAKTCLTGTTTDKVFTWLVCGTGIIDKNGFPQLMTANDWTSILSAKTPGINNLDGHFVIIKWNDEQLQIFTDILGLRDIYIHHSADDLYFTTKPTWLAGIVNLELDYLCFGERWLLPNQVTKKSIFKNFTRIVAGSSVNFNKNNIEIKNSEWSYEKNVQTPEEKFNDRLKKLILVGNRSGVKTSLSLSGGLDSRTILSVLLSHENIGLFNTHTFGDPESPEGRIANHICSDYKIEHEQLNDPLPDTENSLQLIKEYVAQTLMTGFASSVLHLRHYKNLGIKTDFIIDGGFGEIWRRELFNKVLVKAQQHLTNKNTGEFLLHFMTRRAQLFTPELIKQMQIGNQRSLEKLFESMPEVSEIGAENWLDLFSINYTLPTFNCLEQSRMDEFVQGIMPLAQPSLLKLLFSIHLKRRKNGRLIRTILRTNFSDLTKYPLIKNNIIYPFFMTSLSSRVYTRLKSKLGITYENKQRVLFLKNLKEFSLDKLNSRGVREFEYYDYKTIKHNVTAFYNGKDEMINEVDWWLAFELLREQIYKK